MRFGAWHPIETAAAAAPLAPGVIQARAPAVLDYPRGKSAMIFYAASPSALRVHLTGPGAADLARAAEAGARWVRFAETAEAEAEAAADKLLAAFEARFGAPPRANQERRDEADR